MTSTATKSTFWRGIRDGLPFVLGAAPFGLVLGVLMSEAGLNIVEVMSMSVLVIAGAAQFAALAQMQDSAPVLLVVAAALTVNMRLAMYSASIAPHLKGAPLWQRAIAAYVLVDNTYAVSIAEFDNNPTQSMPKKNGLLFWLHDSGLDCLVCRDLPWRLSGTVNSTRICAGFRSSNRIHRRRCTNAENRRPCGCCFDLYRFGFVAFVPAIFKWSVYCGSGCNVCWRGD